MFEPLLLIFEKGKTKKERNEKKRDLILFNQIFFL